MPVEIIKHCNKNNIPVFVIGLKPFAKQLCKAQHIFAKVGEVGKILKALKEHNVHDIVLAGNIKRLSNLFPIERE